MFLDVCETVLLIPELQKTNERRSTTTRTSKGKYKKMWSCKSVSILFFHLYLGHLSSDQKLHDVGYQDWHTKDLEFTLESLLVRNS